MGCGMVEKASLSFSGIIPFQENLLLINQYRPDLKRPYIRLISKDGLIKIQLEEPIDVDVEVVQGVETKDPTMSENPAMVLLNRLKVKDRGGYIVSREKERDNISVEDDFGTPKIHEKILMEKRFIWKTPKKKPNFKAGENLAQVYFRPL